MHQTLDLDGAYVSDTKVVISQRFKGSDRDVIFTASVEKL